MRREMEKMSGWGRTRKSPPVTRMSANPPRAEIALGIWHVCFVPLANRRRVSVSRSIRTRFSADWRQPRRRPVVQGRAMSNGCTFSPPAIRGFDGSKRSRTSRFLTSERATTKVLQAFSLRTLARPHRICSKATSTRIPGGSDLEHLRVYRQRARGYGQAREKQA